VLFYLIYLLISYSLTSKDTILSCAIYSVTDLYGLIFLSNEYNAEPLPLALSSNQFINLFTSSILTSYSFVAPFTKEILKIALFLFSSTNLLIFTSQVAVKSVFSNLAVIVACPSFIAVTFPFSSTFAMLSSLV